LDTSLLLIFSLETYTAIALDCESTHPLENFYGFLRMDCNDINTPEQMMAKIAHTDLVKEAHRVLGLKDRVPGRANLAGVQITGNPPDKVVYDVALTNAIDPQTIAKICLKAVHAKEGSMTDEEQIAFLQFRDFLALLETPARESETYREINQRFNVGSATRIVRLLAVHNRTSIAAEQT
jgi:hypothetical protein